jgi:hypothetical protein
MKVAINLRDVASKYALEIYVVSVLIIMFILLFVAHLHKNNLLARQRQAVTVETTAPARQDHMPHISTYPR